MDIIGWTELDICTDCLLLVANGGGDSVDSSWCNAKCDPGYPKKRGTWREINGERQWVYPCDGTCEQSHKAHTAAVEDNWPSNIWYIALGSQECEYCGGEDEECEAWFSHSGCDLCGSSLGGSRSHAIAGKLAG